MSPVDPSLCFTRPSLPQHRLCEALRAFFVEHEPVKTIAARFACQPGTLYVAISRWRNGLLSPFFKPLHTGPNSQPKKDAVRELVFSLRKKNHSVYDIHRHLQEQDRALSAVAIWEMLKSAGFARLPRRLDDERPKDTPIPIPAEYADRNAFNLKPREFKTQAGGLFLFLPLLLELRLDRLIQQAGYPGSARIPAFQHILSLLALKLLGRERISHVMDLAHDPGAALWSGLNALPKTTALTAYSYRVRRTQNLAFLKLWDKALLKTGLVKGESFNLDFHAIAHFGEEAVLEKNYVPRRSRSERSIMTFLAQDGDSTVLCYSHAGILKRDRANAVVTFADCWKETTGRYPAELVFDSRLTTHTNLSELNRRGIRFLTLRRKSKGIVQKLMALPAQSWTRVELDVPQRKYRYPEIPDQTISLQGYKGKLRQIAAKDLGPRDLPTLLMTDDFKTAATTLLARYAKRMIIENAIADGVHFFHLDALCSSLEVEVDFSVILTIAGDGLCRLFTSKLRGFEHCTAKQVRRKFINTLAYVAVHENETIGVHFPLRAHNPMLVEAGFQNKTVRIPWLNNARVCFTFPADTSRK